MRKLIVFISLSILLIIILPVYAAVYSKSAPGFGDSLNPDPDSTYFGDEGTRDIDRTINLDVFTGEPEVARIKVHTSTEKVETDTTEIDSNLTDIPQLISVDFTEDGLWDIVGTTFATGNNDVKIRFLKTQTGTDPKYEFVQTASFKSTIDKGGSGSMNGADYDKDGNLDLFIIRNIEDGSGGIKQVPYYKGTGLYQFEVTDIKDNSVKNITSGAYTSLSSAIGPNDWTGNAISSKDFDGDGNTDVIIGNANGEIVFLKNDGTGQFNQYSKLLDNSLTGMDSTDGSGNTTVDCADVDEDGKPDLIVSSTESRKIAWYKNNGYDPGTKKWSFTENVIVRANGNLGPSGTWDDDAEKYIYRATAVCANDLDGDGHVDFAITTDCHQQPSDPKYGRASWYMMGDGTGKFNCVLMNKTDPDNDGNWLEHFKDKDADGGTIGDFNGDGICDFISPDGNDHTSFNILTTDVETIKTYYNARCVSHNLITLQNGSKLCDYDKFDSKIYVIKKVKITADLPNIPENTEIRFYAAVKRDNETHNPIWIGPIASGEEKELPEAGTCLFWRADLLAVPTPPDVPGTVTNSVAPSFSSVAVQYTVQSTKVKVKDWRQVK